MAVYGSSESPHERCFAVLADLWQHVNSSYFKSPKFSLPFFSNLQKKTVTFLTDSLRDETASLKEDYKELALILALLYLGGSLSSPILI